ncbi:DUF2637 domain-containing protein [Streptomyces sp. NPDC050423]|uniref:DUF2637 domain-containing protein n=1 Tax=Streptomyces sp. NPDC050423 TaxID=3155402 RepID=UPI00343ACBDA
MQLTRTHRILIGLVVAGAVLIAAIGFAGSYSAVRELALEKGFGNFSLVFPIGIDAGICVLLSLDLLLTWLRIPFPLLRQTAWMLTAATIAFNGAAAWPDPLGVGMHAVIPVLFVVSVEAARHAVGRIADITADKHMEGVRLTRWLLSPIPTFRLWRRMKLWELRSYEQVIKLEQDRLIYQARLQARFGRSWRRKAPVESLMPLRLAKYGIPLAETGPAGLAAAGIEPVLLPPAPAPAEAVAAVETAQFQQPELVGAPQQEQYAEPEQQPQNQQQNQQQIRQRNQQQNQQLQQQSAFQPHSQAQAQAQAPDPASYESPWFAAQAPDGAYEGSYNPTYVDAQEPGPVMIPTGPGRTRPLGNVGTIGAMPAPRGEQRLPVPEAPEAPASDDEAPASGNAPDEPKPVAEAAEEWAEEWAQEDAEFSEIAYEVFAAFVTQHSTYPSIEVLDIHLSDGHNVRHPRSAALLRQLIQGFKNRYHAELEAEHIA